jgi:O-methyltransferase
MKLADIEKLFEDVEEQVLLGVNRFGLLGSGGALLPLLDWFQRFAPTADLTWFRRDILATATTVKTAALDDLARTQPPVVIVVVDEDKEDVIREALPFLSDSPKLIVAGYGHLGFRDPTFSRILDGLLVPSIANGYPNSLVHLYQCLENASRLGLSGVVAEFGVFRGGTTMFLARVIQALDQRWPVIGFDTFGGFPPRRSALDMYDHPGAEFADPQSVRHYLDDENVELVEGDIVTTADRLSAEDVVLTFIDTDNFSSARAAIDVVAERTVVGGAIVFDHFTGVDRFRYTIGERMAGESLLADDRYFNLHSTGVFLRQH